MKINGNAVTLSTPTPLLDFLRERGYRPELVAVERNGQIVPKAQFAATTLMDEDEVEIVSFVGGG
ncbi:sulfur carrier protein ThiS [Zongyangia hominis]|uniref:Sulfur carrier protein ThiS n=1 Tax=Zongyangia hominis TaxID=2763677 RepID=A0A926IC72_9FIRM|nr:sulfur carrier protein ThiS [Zongyangia hominis]MBC8570810.1 sulfur carrier protein ThiS [Zongyangia hominis]